MLDSDYLNLCALVMMFFYICIGLIVYFVFGVSHSNAAVFNRIEEFEEKSPGRVRFDEPPQLSTRLRNVQPENKDVDSQKFVFSDDTEMLDFPQNR